MQRAESASQNGWMRWLWARRSTLHRAGRSHPAVQHPPEQGQRMASRFPAGAEEGLVPHHHALQDDDALDGELRLLYVAMTRVRERLYVSYCRQRERGGRVERPAAVSLAVRPAARIAGDGRRNRDGASSLRASATNGRDGSTPLRSRWLIPSKMLWLGTASSSSDRGAHSSAGVRFTPTVVVQTCTSFQPPGPGGASDAVSAATC